MEIQWLGWAGVELEHDGATLVIDPLADPADTAFGLYALASATSQAIQLEEPGAGERARRCFRALLGLN